MIDFSYKPTVCRVGYIGKGRYTPKKDKYIYKRWKCVIERCYVTKNVSNRFYKNIFICEEWHNFQNFAAWFEENYVEGWHLDKDILIKGNKVYSPETCCFVPREINNLFTTRKNQRSDLPIGVSKPKDYNKYISRIHRYKKDVKIGIYTTIEEAFQAYKEAKEKYIKEVADKWKDKINERVYKSLNNYKVKITD